MTGRQRPGSRRLAIRLALITGIAATVTAAGAPPATAATQVGETFAGATGGCDSGGTVLQSTSPGSPPQYAAPFAGVITSWSFHATPVAPTLLKLKVARPVGGNTFTIVGESPAKSPIGGVLNTYTDVQIPVQTGDIIGFYVESASDDAECFRAAPGFGFHATGGDPPPGSTAEYEPFVPGAQMNISAVLEPDCDTDDFGDETQDPALPLSEACGKGNRTLTLDANKNKVKKGKKVRLTGRISSAARQGPCETAQAVELQRKRPKQASFTTFVQVQTDAQGSFSRKKKVKKTFEFRAQAVETASCTAALSNPEKVKVKKKK